MRRLYFYLFVLAFGLISCESDQVFPVTTIELKGDCDTSNVTFTKIQQIIDNDCKSCHSGSNIHGGINLDGYENIKNTAASGKLMGGLYSSMDIYLRNKCEFAQLQAWIQQGFKNN